VDNVDRRIFYTALYHSMMMPTMYTDVNGLYVGFDKQVHTAEGFQYYTDLSMWDTFRTLWLTCRCGTPSAPCG